MTDSKSKIAKIIALVVGGIVLGVILAFLLGYFVMLLWNWLMPELFGLPKVTYWQACGLFLLAKLFFGIGGGHGGKNSGKGHRRHDNQQAKEKFRKWLESREAEAGSEDQTRQEP